MSTLGLQVSYFWYSRYLLNGNGGKQASFVVVTMGSSAAWSPHLSSQDTWGGLFVPVGGKLGTLALREWALAK